MAGNPGIYCILHRKSGDCYVGQAESISDRFVSHKQLLRAGDHHSKKLQAVFDRDGPSSLAFQALEYCQLAELDGKEYDWIVKLRPPYNTLVPDYAAIATGREPPKRLRRITNPDRNEPSRFLCECGNLKSISSRWCLRCSKVKVAEMQAAGYLPPVRDWDTEDGRPGSFPVPLSSVPADAFLRPRFDKDLPPPDQYSHRKGPDPMAGKWSKAWWSDREMKAFRERYKARRDGLQGARRREAVAARLSKRFPATDERSNTGWLCRPT